MDLPWRQKMIWPAIFVVALCLGTAGCYPDWPGHTGTANVEGEFTLDGFPHAGANLVFVPDRFRTESRKVRPIAYGVCDANGKFKLAYSDGSRDIIAGRYNVLISLIDRDKSKPPLKMFVLPNSSDRELEDELSQLIDRDQVVPSFYNRESELYYDLEPSPAIVRCEFKLTSVDPLIKKSD